MELSFNEPEGPPGRGAISQPSFIQLHPHVTQSWSWTWCRQCLKTQVISRGGRGEVWEGLRIRFAKHEKRIRIIQSGENRKEEGKALNNNGLQSSLCQILFSLPQGRGSVGVERLRLESRRMSQLWVKPWPRKSKIPAEETKAHRGCLRSQGSKCLRSWTPTSAC